jgi:hypothetical protein
MSVTICGKRTTGSGSVVLDATSLTDPKRGSYLWFGNSFRKGNDFFDRAILKRTLEPE